MQINKLTDAQCRGFKPMDKAYKKSDGHGMYLFVTPSGSKVWRLGYRNEFGKEQVHVLGPYPLLSLSEARTKRDEIRLKLLNGDNIKSKPKKSITFSEAVNAYWLGQKDATGKLTGGRMNVSQGYRDNATRGLAMHLEPFIGNTPIAMITKEMVLDALMKLDAAEKFVYAKRIRVWAGQVFDWAVEHGHCAINPAAQIKPEKAFRSKPVEHFPSLPLAELPDFLRRMSLEQDIQSVLAFRLLMLTWVRTKELRMMKWAQIEGATWRVPRGNMKMGREHLVPLSKQALAILQQLKMRSRGGDYVFPNDRRIDRPMSENSILYLIHRIGYKGRMTGHGCRSVASTWANEHEYNPDHVEMQLSHDDNDEVRGSYNNALYLKQRTVMMQAYADWVDGLCQPDAGRLQGGQAPA